jgi:hypothetical protein
MTSRYILGSLHGPDANGGPDGGRLSAFLNGVGLSTPSSQRFSGWVGCLRAASSEDGVNTQRPQRSEDERC